MSRHSAPPNRSPRRSTSGARSDSKAVALLHLCWQCRPSRWGTPAHAVNSDRFGSIRASRNTSGPHDVNRLASAECIKLTCRCQSCPQSGRAPGRAGRATAPRHGPRPGARANRRSGRCAQVKRHAVRQSHLGLGLQFHHVGQPAIRQTARTGFFVTADSCASTDGLLRSATLKW